MRRMIAIGCLLTASQFSLAAEGDSTGDTGTGDVVTLVVSNEACDQYESAYSEIRNYIGYSGEEVASASLTYLATILDVDKGEITDWLGKTQEVLDICRAKGGKYSKLRRMQGAEITLFNNMILAVRG